MITGKHMCSSRHWQEEKFPKGDLSEMTKEKEYAFVLDVDGKRLDPTTIQKAWILIRKGKAKLVSKYPMVIQLNRVIKEDDMNTNKIRCGVDDGGLHVGVALVQECNTKNKVLFKGTIEQRNDVKKLMDIRRGHRRYRRNNKRYRQARFNNRSSSKRKGRIAPSILQKRQATLRVIQNINKLVHIDSFYLEDVCIDIRSLTDGFKLYNWQYQKSNRLDENLRKATILRDNCKCMMCGKKNCKLEVHHIKPKRLGGSNTISNLITLCKSCHDKTENKEELFMDMFYQKINSNRTTRNINYASYVMIGKQYLRNELSGMCELNLTTGGDTANKRIDWDIEKSHSNDAVCITGLKPDTCYIKDWIIKPMRRQNKAKTDDVLGIKHRDLVSYTYKNGETCTGYATGLYPELNALNFQSPTTHCKKVNAKKCKLLWRYNKIYWLENVI